MVFAVLKPDLFLITFRKLHRSGQDDHKQQVIDH